jgi:hypothetical protein
LVFFILFYIIIEQILLLNSDIGSYLLGVVMLSVIKLSDIIILVSNPRQNNLVKVTKVVLTLGPRDKIAIVYC